MTRPRHTWIDVDGINYSRRSGEVHVRPIYQVLTNDAHGLDEEFYRACTPADAATWPQPQPHHDLDGQRRLEGLVARLLAEG